MTNPRAPRFQTKTITKTPRRCMCCKNKFLSDGPHNRLCKNCNTIARDMGPMDIIPNVQLRKR